MTQIFPNHESVEGVAQLKREIAELREDFAYLTRDSLRQEREHAALHRIVSDLSQRVGNTMPNLEVDMVIAKIGLDLAQSKIKNLDNKTDGMNSWLYDLDRWLQHLASGFWPKLQALHERELKRFFPKGFGVIPNDCLPKKPPRS